MKPTVWCMFLHHENEETNMAINTHFCDAIEHNVIIYAIDKADGTTYCWDGACKLFSSDFNDNAMTLFELFVMIGISLFEQNLIRTMAMY